MHIMHTFPSYVPVSRYLFRSAGTFAICGFIQGESWGSFNLLAVFPSGDSGPPTTTTVAPSDVTLIMREKRGSHPRMMASKFCPHGGARLQNAGAFCPTTPKTEFITELN